MINEILKSAKSNWLCKTETKDEPCPPEAVEFCKKEYPQLKCHKNER